MSKSSQEKYAQGYHSGVPTVGAGGMPDPASMAGVHQRETERAAAERDARALAKAVPQQAQPSAPAGMGPAEAAKLRARRQGLLGAARMLVDACSIHRDHEGKVGDPPFARSGSHEAALEADEDYRNWVWATWFAEVSPIEAAVGQHDPEVSFRQFHQTSNGFTRGRDMTSHEVMAYLETHVGEDVPGLAEALRDLGNGSAVRHLERLIRTQHAAYPGRGNWTRTATRRETIAAREAAQFQARRDMIARQQETWARRDRTRKGALAVGGVLVVAFLALLLLGL